MVDEHTKRILNIYFNFTKNLLKKVKNSKFENLVKKLLNLTLSCDSNKNEAIDVCSSILKLRDQSLPEFTAISFNTIKNLMNDLAGNSGDSSETMKTLVEFKDTAEDWEDPGTTSVDRTISRMHLTRARHRSSSDTPTSSSCKRKSSSQNGPPAKILALLLIEPEPGNTFEDSSSDEPVKSSEDEPVLSPRPEDVAELGDQVQIDLPGLANLDEEPQRVPRLYQMIKKIGFTLATNDGGKIALLVVQLHV